MDSANIFGTFEQRSRVYSKLSARMFSQSIDRLGANRNAYRATLHTRNTGTVPHMTDRSITIPLGPCNFLIGIGQSVSTYLHTACTSLLLQTWLNHGPYERQQRLKAQRINVEAENSRYVNPLVKTLSIGVVSLAYHTSRRTGARRSASSTRYMLIIQNALHILLRRPRSLFGFLANEIYCCYCGLQDRPQTNIRNWGPKLSK